MIILAKKNLLGIDDDRSEVSVQRKDIFPNLEAQYQKTKYETINNNFFIEIEENFTLKKILFIYKNENTFLFVKKIKLIKKLILY